MENNVIRCVIYARQSKTLNGSESIQAQVEACQYAAERMGFSVVQVLAEPPSTSGYKNRGKSREKFRALLEGFTDRRWEMVLAYKTDRLSRGGGPGWAPLLDAIEAANLDLDRAIATPSGFISEFEIGIRASMDREESKKLSERMQDLAERKARQGKPHNGGRRPFGYESDYVTIREDEAMVLKEMAQRVLSGESFRAVAWWLNENGHKTTTGKDWYPITVRNLLAKPRYYGYRSFKDEEIKAIWEPIFDQETADKLKLELAMRTQRKDGVPKPRRYLLTGLLFCGKCGEPLNGMTKRDNPSCPLRRTYQCRTVGDSVRKAGCGGVTRGAEAVEHWVRESIFAHLKSSPVLEELGAKNEDAEIVRGLIKDREMQRARLEQFVDDYATGLLTRPQLERAKTTAQNELERIERLLMRYASTNSLLMILPNGNPEESWNEGSDDWKRSLVTGLIERIIVQPGNTKPFYNLDGKTVRFDPSLVIIEWRDFQ